MSFVEIGDIHPLLKGIN